MKKFGKILISFFCALLCGMVLCSCSFLNIDDGKVKVTSIVLAKTEVAVASYGDNTTFQIYPTVYPENVENKKVTFQFQSIKDTEFVSVTDTGLVTGRKPKEGGTVEILVKSVANPKITASVFVTVEDRPVENIYFAPNRQKVYIDQKTLTVQAQYFPAHAAEGTLLSYSSDNPEVATVDSTGKVTLLSRGTTNIKAANNDKVQGFLELQVLCTPPSYRLEEAPTAANAYNQVPGQQIPIMYTLIPGQNNDANCNIKWYAESKEVVSARNKLTFQYVPSYDLSPHVYHVEVTVTDSDNQLQNITSKSINIYNNFTNVLGIDMAASAEYFVSDSIALLPMLNLDEQRPTEFKWYLRVLKEGEGNIDFKDLNKYTLLGKSAFLKEDGRYTYLPNTAGRQVIAMVPIVNKIERTDCLVYTAPFEVKPLKAGSPFYRTNFVATQEGDANLLKLNWNFMPGETEFVIEVTKNGTKTIVSSTDPVYAARFSETSFVFPQNLLSTGTSATVRLRTNRFGYGEPLTYTANSVLYERELLRLDTPISGLPFTYYMKSMAEIGNVLNYIRFFRPGQAGYAQKTSGIEYKIPQGTDGQHSFSVNLGFAFQFADCDTTKYDKTKKPFSLVDSFYLRESDVTSALDAQARYLLQDYNEAVDKVLLAFLSYGESGKIRFMIEPKYFGTTGAMVNTKKGSMFAPLTENQGYTAKVTLFLPDEPTTGLVSEQTLKKNKVTSGYTRTISKTPRATTYDNYFVNNRGDMPVQTSQQLYLAAMWGYRPVCAVGSVAESVLNVAKRTLNRILGADIVTQTDKVKAMHDWLVCEVDYDYNLSAKKDADALSEGFCLDGAFLKNYAVCDGLSKAFTLMSWMEGVVSFKISGSTGGDNATGHAWNKVMIDGIWFLLDSTWDGTYIPDAMRPDEVHPIALFLLKKDGDTGFREELDRRTYGEYPNAK